MNAYFICMLYFLVHYTHTRLSAVSYQALSVAAAHFWIKLPCDSVTITIESSTSGPTTLFHINLSAYVGLVTMYNWKFASRVRIRVRIRFSVWLVGCHAHRFVLLSFVIVTLPCHASYICTILQVFCSHLETHLFSHSFPDFL